MIGRIRGRASRGLLILAVVALAACGPPGPSGEAKTRVATLAADSIKVLSLPGGELLGEGSNAGHKTQAPYGQGLPTVGRDYTFTGDARVAARAVLDQGREAGWRVYVNCNLADQGTFFVRGAKRFTDSTGAFAGRFEAMVWTRPQQGDQAPRREVLLDITTSYPGEKPDLDSDTTTSTTLAPEPTCLD